MNGKKKYFKHGNPELYNYFTDDQRKNMSEREKAMWTTESQMDEAPISLEVLDFQSKQDKKKIEELEEGIVLLNEQLDQANADNLVLRDQAAKGGKPGPLKPNDDLADNKPPKTDEEAEKKLVQEELRKLGVRFAYNTGLPKLKEKLEEAQNANNSK